MTLINKISRVNKAAVIGAGTMGSGIAAQFANAGVPVVLLDIVPAGAQQRSIVAESAIERQLKVGGFVHSDQAALVTPGNLEDHLQLLADADWIVEAVIENVEVKRELYGKLERVRKDGSIVSSNTSTILRASLVQGMAARFSSNFLITHFFNPPRRMRLLELVAGDEVPAEITERAREACESLLGKTVITCRDTPGFIANRLGCYWMSVAAIEAIEMGLRVEEADAVAGLPFGVPPTGIFGLFDLVGLDLAPGVWGSLYKALPEHDAFQAYDLPGHPVIRRMIEEDKVGRKAGGGFYRQADRSSPRETLDLATGGYRPFQPADFPSLKAAAGDLSRLCEAGDDAGRYAWKVLSRLVAYAAQVGPEIADDVLTIDLGMTLGYAWAQGPFALADRVGVARIAERLAREGEAIPELLAAAVRNGGFYKDGGCLRTDGRLQDRAARPGVMTVAAGAEGCVAENAGARLMDMGGGLACLELRGRKGYIDESVMEMLERLPGEMRRGFASLVICGGAQGFSAGVNPELLLKLAGDPVALGKFLARGQMAFAALRDAPFPVVGAATGTALGAGAELLLHCAAVVAHAELAMGLDQGKCGLTPSLGGCGRLLARAAATPRSGGGPGAVASRIFELVFEARVSKSARDAQALGLLRASDSVVMNEDHVLAEACALARKLADAGHVPPEPELIRLPGRSGRAALLNFVHGHRVAGRVTGFEARLAEALADVVTGGCADPVAAIPEAQVLQLERQAALSLAATPEAQERMRHLAATGRPLRN
jgi:3-hydroxyacyl-CoA dehydrogenase